MLSWWLAGCQATQGNIRMCLFPYIGSLQKTVINMGAMRCYRRHYILVRTPCDYAEHNAVHVHKWHIDMHNLS